MGECPYCKEIAQPKGPISAFFRALFTLFSGNLGLFWGYPENKDTVFRE
jgi:hypothetical protein